MRRPLTQAGGTLTILRHLPAQRRAAHHPRADLEAARDARVRAAVRHAARHVSYYADIFHREGIQPEEIRTAADLARLPLIDRTVLQAEGERFRSRTRAGRRALALRTTGSTAMPLTVYHDRSSLLANVAYSERERAVEARLVDRSYGYLSLDVRAAAGTVNRVQAFYADASFRPLRPRRRPISVDTPPEEAIEAVDRVRPDVIRSYGGYLELLFRVASDSGTLRHRPKAVVYSGDTMSAAGRELIEDEFGIPVLSAYNAVECFKIAFTCERRDGFHVHEDLCHVRIVGPDGEELPAGEKGEVVVSNLVNRGTVLLNYRLGDLARIVEEPCECGRTFRRLADLEGRVDEVIGLGGGAYVYPTRVWAVFRERAAILRYQLVQHAGDRFELKVVAADGSRGERAALEAAAELRALLAGAEVGVTLCADLPAGPGGKFRHVIPLRGGDVAVGSSHAGG